MPNTTTHNIGRTVVYVDSRGNPYKFVRDGEEVPCVCDEQTGIKCEYHKRTMKEQSIPAEEK